MSIKDEYVYNIKNIVTYKDKGVGSKGGGHHYVKKELNAKHLSHDLIKNNSEERRKVLPPEWLNKESKKIFRKIVKDFEYYEILDIIDSELLAVYSDMLDKYINLRKDIQELNDRKDIQGNKLSFFQKDKTNAAIKYSALLLQYACKLGLSPDARKRISDKIAEKIIEKTENEKKFNV